jgi:hypothetical protein
MGQVSLTIASEFSVGWGSLFFLMVPCSVGVFWLFSVRYFF